MPSAGKTASALLRSTKLGGSRSLDAFALAFVAFTVDLANATTYTFTGHALGAAVSGVRYTIICANAHTATSVSTLTVGGLSASLVAASGPIVCEIWICDTSSLGTTADIVVTASAGVLGMGVGVYRMANPGSGTATDTDTSGHVSGVNTLTLDIPTGGFAVATVVARESVLPTFTWTGTSTPTENYDADVDAADGASGAISTATGAGLTFIATSTDSSPISQRAAAASWGP